jgi:hypothetical protein
VADERTAKLAFASGLARRARTLARSALQLRRQRRALDQRADLAPAFASACTSSTSTFASVASMRSASLLCARKSSKGLRGGGEAAGHAHAARGELADELAEGRVLAADRGDVGHAQRFQGKDVAGCHGEADSRGVQL